MAARLESFFIGLVLRGTRSCPRWFLPFVTEIEKEKRVCGDLVEKFLSRVLVLSEEGRPDITALVDWA